MKTITIDSIEYSLTPVVKIEPFKYKVGDWVIHKTVVDKTETVRRIVDYSLQNKFYDVYGEWMSISTAIQFNNNIQRLATEDEIKVHLIELATKKGYEAGVSFKSILTKYAYTISVLSKFSYDIFSDTLTIDNYQVYANGVWAEIIEKSKFTFGNEEVTFRKPYGKNRQVEIICKGEIGALYQLENILRNYHRPCQFGNVAVRGYRRYDTFNSFGHIGINNEYEDIKNINTISIGCLTGTYKELSDIYNHCLTLK